MPVRLTDTGLSTSAVIDGESYAEILSMMPDDSLGELLKPVFESPEGTVHVLLQAMLDQDRQAIGYNAHKLKGTAMLLGFRALVRTSAQIEHIATQTDDPVNAELGTQLLRDTALTQKALQQFELPQTA
jgi:HPt (histidine-containing phosphotransfer) domain-containing protein